MMHKEILLVEDNPDDVERFVQAVKQVGLYWLVLNHPAQVKTGAAIRP